jgi:hypothetical protein
MALVTSGPPRRLLGLCCAGLLAACAPASSQPLVPGAATVVVAAHSWAHTGTYTSGSMLERKEAGVRHSDGAPARPRRGPGNAVLVLRAHL